MSVVATGRRAIPRDIRSSAAASDRTAPLPAKMGRARAAASSSAAAVMAAGAAPVRPSARAGGCLPVGAALRGRRTHPSECRGTPRPAGRSARVERTRHHVVQKLHCVHAPDPFTDRPVDVSL